jgi:hypothetical protein
MWPTNFLQPIQMLFKNHVRYQPVSSGEYHITGEPRRTLNDLHCSQSQWCAKI